MPGSTVVMFSDVNRFLFVVFVFDPWFCVCVMDTLVFTFTFRLLFRFTFTFAFALDETVSLGPLFVLRTDAESVTPI